MVSKKNPAIFVFDLEDNKLNEVLFTDKMEPYGHYPQYPVFDE